MQLHKIQSRFKETMLDHPDNLDAPPADIRTLFASGKIALPERLKVYRNNIVGGLTDILRETFPITDKLVGEDFMSKMAQSFILAHPPESGNMNHYGRDFPAFIADFGPAKALAYLPDVAHLEIALNEAYYAADDQALRPEDLAQSDPADLKLSLRASATLLDSPWPLADIRDFCLLEDQGDQTLDLDAGPVWLLIHRPALETQIVTLLEEEFYMLRALRDGQQLGDATNATLDRFPGFDLEQCLARHLELETFCAIETNS